MVGAKLEKPEAIRLGYVAVSDRYSRREEVFFIAAQRQMSGANWVLVGRSIWRHHSELDSWKGDFAGKVGGEVKGVVRAKK
jgi:hypothetical protein